MVEPVVVSVPWLSIAVAKVPAPRLMLVVLVTMPAPMMEAVEANVGAVPAIVRLEVTSTVVLPDCVPPPERLRLLLLRFTPPALLNACVLTILLLVRLSVWPATSI